MAEYTKYLRLMKPQGNEYYNVENFNHNAELIDKETEKLNTAVTKIQEGATREKAGIVQFGTEEGKALEGMMLARLAGCVGYGGDIQTAGVKDINYIYYDRNTRKMYKCLNQNSDVSANVANFIPLDNNSLLDRLENLYKIEHTPDYDVLTILNRKFVVGSLETKGSTASKTLTANGFSFKNSIVMATAKKDNCSVAVIHSGDNLDFSTLDATSGNVQNGICKVDFFILLKQ